MSRRLPKAPSSREGFRIGIICALTLEAGMVEMVLDKEWKEDGILYGSLINDPTTYTPGLIAGHNVVLAYCPTIGTNAAAQVASSLMLSFTGIKIIFVVGICGAVPTYLDQGEKQEIVLGDCMISTAVVQFDLGERGPAGFREADGLEALGRSSARIRGLMNKIQTPKNRSKLTRNLHAHLQVLQDAAPKRTSYPGTQNDRLFKSTYIHTHRVSGGLCNMCEPKVGICRQSCEDLGCDAQYLENRTRSRDDTLPEIHIGYFGSSNGVLKSGVERDELARTKSIIAFEMEGSGTWDVCSTVIIKAACDYADSHKDKKWQAYAAATAAAGLKAFLQELDLGDEVELPKGGNMTENIEVVLEGKDNECLRDLRTTDPRDDKTRIEYSKGGLLDDAYIWVKDNETFKIWARDSECKVLWITGDAGKGKTMLLCGMINELEKTSASTAYFFFQATDVRLNTGVAALRGLMFSMIRRAPRLIDLVREDYDRAGSLLFEDKNAWFALSRIFLKMLTSPLSKDMNIVLDALDECEKNRDELLQLIVKSAETSSTKWIISSRNWPVIEKQLDNMRGGSRLSLELNEDSVSAAVTTYVQYNVEQLHRKHHYNHITKILITDYLQKHSDNTFLWVALACQHLSRIKAWKAYDALKTLPPGINQLYQRMMDILLESEEVDLLTNVLATVLLVLRPLNMEELVRMANIPKQIADRPADLQELIYECGSFLIYHNESIQFVHASARDYLSLNDERLFPSGKKEAHLKIFRESTNVILSTLVYNMFNLTHPGSHIEDAETPTPDPLRHIKYFCVYFLDHFMIGFPARRLEAEDGELLHQFLTSRWFQWLEAMSLLRSSAKAIQSITELHTMAQTEEELKKMTHGAELQLLIFDAHRFVVTFGHLIQYYPLQVYLSGPLFSPDIGLIKQPLGSNLQSVEILKKSKIHTKEWSNLLYTLEGHTKVVSTVDFSLDGSLIATGSEDKTVKIWSSDSGLLQCTLAGHETEVERVQFSPNSEMIASSVTSSSTHEIWIWHVSSNKLLHKFKMPKSGWSPSTPVTFFPDGDRLASAVGANTTIHVWRLSSIEQIWSHESDYQYPHDVRASHDGRLLAICFEDCFALYNAVDGSLIAHESVQFVDNPTPNRIRFSFDDRFLIYQDIRTVWWTNTATKVVRKECPDFGGGRIAFDLVPKTNCIGIYHSKDPRIRIIDLDTGTLIRRLSFVTGYSSFIFSPMQSDLICALTYMVSSLWHLREIPDQLVESEMQDHEMSKLQDSEHPRFMYFWPCGTRLLVSCTQSWTRIYNVADSTENFHTLLEGKEIGYPAFSRSSMVMIVNPWASEDNETYYVRSDLVQIRLNAKYISYASFSPDGEILLLGSYGGTVNMFRIVSDEPILVDSFRACEGQISDINFQHNGASFVTTNYQGCQVKQWATNSKELMMNITWERGKSDELACSAISPNGQEIAVALGESDAYKISIYNAMTGIKKTSIVGPVYLHGIHYDEYNSYLRTINGLWKVQDSPSAMARLEASKFLTIRGKWIYQGEKKLVWMTSDYGDPAAIHNRTVALWHQPTRTPLLFEAGVFVSLSYDRALLNNPSTYYRTDAGISRLMSAAQICESKKQILSDHKLHSTQALSKARRTSQATFVDAWQDLQLKVYQCLPQAYLV